jgi:hypothetical protein
MRRAERLKYTKEQISEAVSRSTSVYQTLRYLGIQYRSGSAWSMVRSYIEELSLDVSHFRGRGYELKAASRQRKKPEDVLVLKDRPYREKGGVLRRALLEIGVPYRCAECGAGPEWRGKPVVLPVDHRNGDWRDCRPENLRFLCPNCHAQTETSCRRKRPKLSKTRDPSTYHSKAWPEAGELRRLVWSSPVDRVASSLGVSGSAVKKKCNRLGVPTPPRGYWTRTRGISPGGEHTSTTC